METLPFWPVPLRIQAKPRACDEISDALWRERRAGRCKAPRRRRCGDIVEERQRSRCPPAAAPLRAALFAPCIPLSMLVAHALPVGLGACSKVRHLFRHRPLIPFAYFRPVSAKRFCPIQRFIRAFEQFIQFCRVRAAGGDAKAGRNCSR